MSSASASDVRTSGTISRTVTRPVFSRRNTTNATSRTAPMIWLTLILRPADDDDLDSDSCGSLDTGTALLRTRGTRNAGHLRLTKPDA